MKDVLNLSESLLNDLTTDPRNFVGKIIDITSIPNNFTSSLNWDLLAEYRILEALDISEQDLLIEEVERKIRSFAKKVDVQVVALDKENTGSEKEVISLLSKNRILLLK